MNKSLLLTMAFVLLLGMTHRFDGQENTQNHRQLPRIGNTILDRPSTMPQSSLFSRPGLDHWMTEQDLPYPYRMTKTMEQRDFRTNTMMANKTLAQHDLSAGVDTAWVRHYASGLLSSNDEAAAIAVDGSGNIYVTGSSAGYPSGYDYLTIKYDSSGAQLWLALYNGLDNSNDYASALAVDASGNIYVTGKSGSDFATVKYNSAGIEQWVVCYNGPGNGSDGATALAVDASGNVYVTGGSEGSGTGNDCATVKYNSAGVEQWIARYNGPGNARDCTNALAVDASGNVYVTGGSAGSGTQSDYATVKYNSAGIEQWVARYNGTGNDGDWANDIAVDTSGNVYVTGASWGYACTDYATIKYNSDGIEQWVARYNFYNYDEATALALDASGNVYVTGFLNADQNYCATFKYNSDGIKQWMILGYYFRANALAVDGSGNVYVAGRGNGSGIGDDFDDFTIVKYNSAGAQQWAAHYNGPGNSNDGAFALALDGFGNIYVLGWSEISSFNYAYATIKYNSTGMELWGVPFAGPGTANDWASDLAVDHAGNVYVTGWSVGSGTERDYATVKYNSAGFQQWVARYNGPGNSIDEATALAVDRYSNVYVTGKSPGIDKRDHFATVKYDSDGVEQRVARYDGPGTYDDRATALAVDDAGNVYVTGSSDYDWPIGGDYTTIKYNSAGEEQWIAKYNGPGNSCDWANGLIVDASGDVYVTGQSDYSSISYPYYATVKYSSAGIEQWVARYVGYASDLAIDGSGNVYVTGASSGQYVTVKYNSEGVEQWVVSYKGLQGLENWPTALAVDATGNVYVTGSSDVYEVYYGGDYATVKYNSEGIEQWVARYNSPGIPNNAANALVVDASGNVYVTGTSWGSDSSTGDNFATVKYNSEGIEQWVARYNGPANSYDYANALAVDSSGNVYVSGTSASWDGWSVYTTIKYIQSPVSVTKEGPNMPSNYWLAQNYPNPFNPSTTIEFALPKSAFVTLKVYNLLGEEVATLVAEQRVAGIHQLNWDARGLASGVYLYRLEAGDPSTSSGQVFIQSKKLILMR